MQNNEHQWSEWLDFSEQTLLAIPHVSGVYMMHSTMKILFIEGTDNIKKAIEEKQTHPCITNTTRLRYIQTPNYEKIARDLITDYKNRHEGKIPLCMQK